MMTMAYRCIFIGILALAFAARPQLHGSQPPADSPPPPDRPKEASLEKPAAEVPLDLSEGVPVVEVRINGRGPIRFAIDTGQLETRMEAGPAEVLKLPAERGAARTSDGDDSPGSILTMESLAIGDAVFSNLKALAVKPRKKLEFERNYVGSIGLGVFADYLVTIDGPGRRLVLTRGELPAPDGKDVLAYRAGAGPVVIPLTFATLSLDLAVDSLAKGTFILNENWWERIELAAEAAKPRDYGPRLISVERARAFEGDVRLGSQAISRPPVRFHRKDSAIGYELLRQFAVTIDSKNRRIRFARASEEPLAFPPSTPKFGVIFLRSGNELRIHKIMPDSRAAKLPLKEGDFIVDLNGKDPQTFDDRALRAVLQQRDHIVVKVNRNGMPLLVPLDAE
jgi:hypothetical protein